MTIRVYVALLASVLLSLWAGKKPSKAIFQMFRLYFQGWASEKELRNYLASLPGPDAKTAKRPP